MYRGLILRNKEETYWTDSNSVIAVVAGSAKINRTTFYFISNGKVCSVSLIGSMAQYLAMNSDYLFQANRNIAFNPKFILNITEKSKSINVVLNVEFDFNEFELSRRQSVIFLKMFSIEKDND